MGLFSFFIRSRGDATEREQQIDKLETDMRGLEKSLGGLAASLESVRAHTARKFSSNDSQIAELGQAYLTLTKAVRSIVARLDSLPPPGPMHRPLHRPLDSPHRPMHPPQRPMEVATEEALQRLTPQEKALLNAVLGADAPMSYRDIAERLGLKTVTVKGYVRSMEAKGVAFQTVRVDRSGRRWIAMPRALKNAVFGEEARPQVS